MVDRFEKSNGGPHVDTGDNELLRTEGGHLELLKNVEYGDVFGRFGWT